MGRSISELNPREVLGLAIAVETRNAQRYETFAHIFGAYNDSVGALFEEMRDEEISHRAVLEKMYAAHFGSTPCNLDEGDVDEVVEAVDVEDAEHMVFNSLTRRNVLEAALRAEEGARSFYLGLTRTEQAPDLLELYRQLAENEQDHVAFIEQRLRQKDA